jgi:hypothetical protein
MDHLVEKVLEDEAFFEASGGGLLSPAARR